MFVLLFVFKTILSRVLIFLKKNLFPPFFLSLALSHHFERIDPSKLLEDNRALQQKLDELQARLDDSRENQTRCEHIEQFVCVLVFFFF